MEELKAEIERKKREYADMSSVAENCGSTRFVKQKTVLEMEERKKARLASSAIDTVPRTSTSSRSSKGEIKKEKEEGKEKREGVNKRKAKVKVRKEKVKEVKDEAALIEKEREINGEVMFSEQADLDAEKVVYKYFRSLLQRWERQLERRSDAAKASFQGKADAAVQQQCKEHMRALFKMCKAKEVPTDILGYLNKIVAFCENGKFRDAHDVYLKAAIGNAAWPIGVTGVGIHQRAAREKISTSNQTSSNIAHVMTNETTRKYLTGVKRLLTYAQGQRPDVPPSEKVL